MHGSSGAHRPSERACDRGDEVFGRLRLDADRRRATVGLDVVPFSPAEFLVLQQLSRQRGAPLTKADLAAALQAGPVPVDSAMIDVYVNRIRRKLGAAGLAETIISLCGRGYAIRPANEPGGDPVHQPATRPGRERLAAAAA